MIIEIDKNSVEEKGRVIKTAAIALHSSNSSLTNFPGLMLQIIKARAWESRLERGKVIELPSLLSLVTEKPYMGWGVTTKKIEALLQDDPMALTMFREEVYGDLGESRRPTKVEQANKSSATRDIGKACDNTYWQARIKRDFPADYEEIKKGEKTIIQIRKEKGLVSQSKRLTLTGDVSIDKKRLVETFGEQYLNQLIGNEYGNKMRSIEKNNT